MASKSSKPQFYVFYLGWKECRGLSGREFVEPIIRELVYRRNSEDLPKLTMELSKKEMKITQLIEKKNKQQKLKYPPIPTKDITYAIQSRAPDDDVVACIYLGYNPQTRAAVHVHVYRFDSEITASVFVEHLYNFIDMPENKQRASRIEQELVSKGQVVASRSPSGPSPYNNPSMPPSSRHGYNAYDRNEPYYDYERRRPYSGSRENLGRDSPRNMPRDAIRDMPRDAIRDMPRDAIRDMPRDAIRDMPRDIRRDMPREAPRDDPYQRDPYSRSEYGRPEPRGYESDQRDYREARTPREPAREPPRDLNPPYRYEPPLSPLGRDMGRDYDRDADVYQSVTEELKAKLKGRATGGQGPVLLPPKDYDTVHRNVGNLIGIEERKSTNTNLVSGENYRDDNTNTGSSRGSYEDPYNSRNDDDYQRYRGNRPPGPITRAARSPEPRSQPWRNGENRRSASPEPRKPYDGDPRRGRSPTRSSGPQYSSPAARAMSPPPGHELRNSYFPPSDTLPNYLAPGDAGHGGRNSPRPLSPGRYGDRSSDDGSKYGNRNPKYTATRLGLIHGASMVNNPGPRPRSDEGYLSMDRTDNTEPSNRTQSDSDFGYGKPRARDSEDGYRKPNVKDNGFSYGMPPPKENGYDRGTSKDYGYGKPSGHSSADRDQSPPPKAVIAGEEAHPELLEANPDLPGSGQPFLY